MPTEAEIQAAKDAEAAAGAKPGESPTPEQLRAAQDAAESARKEAAGVKESLKEKEAELVTLNEKVSLSEADRQRRARLELGIEDDKLLHDDLMDQYNKGDRNARAYVTMTREEAHKTAKDVVHTELAKDRYNREITQRDDVIEVAAKEWNKDLPKEEQVSADKFEEMIDPFAAAFPTDVHGPLKQTKLTIAAFRREQNLKAREAHIEEVQQKDARFRDGGTGHDGNKGKGGEKGSDWRAAKTPAEKEAALADI